MLEHRPRACNFARRVGSDQDRPRHPAIHPRIISSLMAAFIADGPALESARNGTRLTEVSIVPTALLKAICALFTATILIGPVRPLMPHVYSQQARTTMKILSVPDPPTLRVPGTDRAPFPRLRAPSWRRYEKPVRRPGLSPRKFK
jgi:hypothetical protein